MNKEQQKVFASIFKNPVQSNVKWADVEQLFASLDAEVSEGSAGTHRTQWRSCGIP